jgi:hypothetical protein
MPSNKCNAALLAAILCLGTINGADAQPAVGVRAAGLAGAFVGVADDASAVYWNPAGVATGAIISAIVMFGAGDAAPENSQAAVGQRHTARLAALSVPPIGLAYYRIAAYGTESATPAVVASQSREEVRRSVYALTTSVVGVSLLQSLNDYIVVGVTPKFVRGSAARGSSARADAREALDDASGLDGRGETTFDVDAGVMLAVQRIRLGLVARNLTTPAFDVDAGEAIALDREVRVGGAWGSSWPGISRVIVSVDGDVTSRRTPSGDRRDVAAGVETWWWAQRLGLRGGVRRSTIGDGRAAAAAGISAALGASMFVEAHVVRGRADERGWSVGLRMGF